MITIREMSSSDMARIEEIDRSEEISQNYVTQDGGILLKEVEWHVPTWFREGAGAHSVEGKIQEWRPVLDQGGTLFGAFDGQALVGFALYCPYLADGLAQFVALHVSRAHRRQGVGRTLAAKVMERAKQDGAGSLYVSSVPTRGTVEFYQSFGWRLAEPAHKELYEREPEDIHMILDL